RLCNHLEQSGPKPQRSKNTLGRTRKRRCGERFGCVNKSTRRGPPPAVLQRVGGCEISRVRIHPRPSGQSLPARLTDPLGLYLAATAAGRGRTESRREHSGTVEVG